METDAWRELLRHTLATVAYSGGKAIRDPLQVSEIFAPEKVDALPEILALELPGLGAVDCSWPSQSVWKDSKPLAWDREGERLLRQSESVR